MKKQELKSNILLLITATIWGMAFVAQKVGAKYIGPFAFNGVRFALGGISLIPLLLYFNKAPNQNINNYNKSYNFITPGIITGCVLFFGVSFQQIGLNYTSAGKAAFITGLYIVFVPIISIFLKRNTPVITWISVTITAIGLYFLSVNENFSISQGDLLEIIGAFFWAIHILLIDRFIKKVDGLKLSFVQILTCSILSMTVSLIFEKTNIHNLYGAIIPILYGGIFSVGIAYTLQILGQRHAKPSHAAIILSMESVFATIGGMIILSETLQLREYLGCFLMMSGMLLSQLSNFGSAKS
ncbi:DMT family transporter [Clostridium sp. WILCCON 0269]|uniref:DMT family transporter n=1 Tax=Candidatus Clostridium eludens TaxID=3381663 RepID=A0ABW8SLD0_9CLOT